MAAEPECFSTGFASSVVLLRHVCLLKRAVPQHQVFTKIRVALPVVTKE